MIQLDVETINSNQFINTSSNELLECSICLAAFVLIIITDHIYESHFDLASL